MLTYTSYTLCIVFDNDLLDPLLSVRENASVQYQKVREQSN